VTVGSKLRQSLLGKEDIDAVMEVERRCFDSPWTPGQFRHELKVPFSRTVLLWDDSLAPSRVAGYVCRWLVGDEVSILNLAVDDSYRGTGLGRALVGLILDEAAERQASVVTLEVREKNDAARGLYASFGFERAGTRRDYYGKGENAIIMTKRMAPGAPNAEALCPSPDRGV
jgi:[ribosomal protein S18]-alanine N-acetyltransferase